MTLSKTFTNTAKAALVAGLMAIMGMAAAPAQAATGSLTFSFGNAATHNGVVPHLESSPAYSSSMTGAQILMTSGIEFGASEDCAMTGVTLRRKARGR